MNPQNIHAIFFYYTLTVGAVLAIHYYQLVQERQFHSQQASVYVFQNIKNNAKSHNYYNHSLDEIIRHHQLNKFSYQLFIEKKHGSDIKHNILERDEGYNFGLPLKPRNNSVNNASYYTLVDKGLVGWIKLKNNDLLSINLVHRPLAIEFNRAYFWSPLMLAAVFWFLFGIMTLRRYNLWIQTLAYVTKITAPSSRNQRHNTYAPLKFDVNIIPQDFAILANTMSRANYQLYHRQRQIDTLLRRLERLVNHSPLPMAFIQRNGKVNFINERFKALFMVSLQKDDDYHITDFVKGENEQAQQRLIELDSQKISRSIVVKHMHNEHTYQLHITPWFSAHGQVQGFTAMLSNIHVIHEELDHTLKELNKKSLQVTEFDRIWSVMGHELRTPLSGIIGMLELIHGDNLNKEQFETFETLKHTSQTMLQMLNDMLDLAKLDAGKLNSTQEKTDVLQMCRQVCELMVGNARRQGIELLLIYKFDTVRYIDTDEARLRQILLNLIGNAIKFTQQGHVALVVSMQTAESLTETNTDKTNEQDNQKHSSVKMHTHKQNDYFIHFEIKDTGIGISETEQKRLFSYFGQANSSISSQFGGTGLGLAISKNFAKLLDGDIGVTSEAGAGSTFYVSLPMQLKYQQRVYEYQSDFSKVALIYISSNKLNANYIEELAVRYNISAIVKHDVNLDNILNTIAVINEWLTQQENAKLYPVVFIDYELFNQDTKTDSTPTQNAQEIEDDNGQSLSIDGVFSELYNNEKTPKVLMSMTPERNIHNHIIDKFQGYIQKPLDVSYLISELLRLGQEQTSLSRISKLQMSFNEFIQSIHSEDSSPTNDLVTANQDNTNNGESMSFDSVAIEGLAVDANDATSSLTNAVEQDTQHTTKPSPAKISNTRPIILVAEDNPINQKVAVKLLDKMGYDTITANNGEEAIARLTENRDKVRLVLMDCRMPTLDGLEATQMIRKKGDSIPIIALTANDTDEDRKACLHAGMDNFLSKPIKRDALQSLLSKYSI